MTATRLIIGVFALACVPVCGIASNLVSFEMVEKVNERLPKDQQFAALWWHWPKNQRLWREYRMLYPDGTLLRRLLTLGASMFACILTCAWAFGFFAG
jgi:hypothetical protein